MVAGNYLSFNALATPQIMISKLYNIWKMFSGNLWFLPVVISLTYLGLTFGVYFAERGVLSEYDFTKFLYNGGVEDAKRVTIALLASMITMATLSISITIVALTLAASQLGPRLIRTFMRDSKTQQFIGVFFGAVIACFALSIILYDAQDDFKLPSLTISFVFTLCFINLFALLGFVNHLGKSCIADEMIKKVSENLMASINRLTHEKGDKEKTPHKKWLASYDRNTTSITSSKNGYIQYIDRNELLNLATDNNTHIKVLLGAGDHVVKHQVVAKISKTNFKDSDLLSDINNAFVIGESRTSTQDIEYSLHHLVEIAIRALSPGINDSYTALSVIDHVTNALAFLLSRELPEPIDYDDKKTPRVMVKSTSEIDMVRNAYEQIRHSGRMMPVILNRLIASVETLMPMCRYDRHVEALQSVSDEIEQDIKSGSLNALEKKEISARCAALKKDLEALKL